ncbi:hypothetical protein HOY82DRAFT_649290 [Tuber indicum]|nr:hypothetical protein HOY82DRAFT_649290 [Tuber indicum]
MVQRKTTWGAKTIATTGEAMVAAMIKLAEQEREIGRLQHHVSMLSKKIHVLRGADLGDGTRWRKAREEKEEVAFGVAPAPVAPPLEAVVPEPVVAEPSGAVVACVASVEEVAEEVVEEVALVAHTPPMDMELTEEEKVTEVQVSGEMLRVLREEEEKKAGWKVVARDNKKRKVDDVIVAPLGPKTWAVGKGKVGRVVVTNGVLDVVPTGPRSVRQYMKAETGGKAAGGLGIGPIASSIPKGPSALLTYIGKHLDTLKSLFPTLHGERLMKPHTATIDCYFDDYCKDRMRELGKQEAGSPPMASNVDSRSITPVIVKEKSHAPPPQPPMPGIMNSKPMKSIPLGNLIAPATPEITLHISPEPGDASHLVTVNKHPIRGSGGRRGHASATYPSSGEEISPATLTKRILTLCWTIQLLIQIYRRPRRVCWRDGTGTVDYVDQKEWGSKTSKGEFVLKDLDTEPSAILKEYGGSDISETGFRGELEAPSVSQNLVGGEVLTKADLEKPAAATLDPLLRRNIAR